MFFVVKIQKKKIVEINLNFHMNNILHSRSYKINSYGDYPFAIYHEISDYL